MRPEDLFRHAPHDPLDLWLQEEAPPSRLPRARCLRFELTNRGDRVPGRLLLPTAGRAPFPGVILQHGAGGSKEADYLEVAAAPWVERGVAIASIDFPLHGARASTKLAERITSGSDDPSLATLRTDFVRQAVTELRRTLDALERIPEVDASRTAYAGFSLGSLLGALFCAWDERPRAAAFALGGGGFGPGELDPVSHVGRIAPRPVLFVNAVSDETIPREAAEALHAAAREPKEIAWFEGTHTRLPGLALKAMWTFLARHLEIR